MAVQLKELSEGVASAAARHWERIREVQEWALAHGRPVQADDVALITAAREQAMKWDGVGFDHWTRVGVYHHVRIHTFNWCSINRVLLPERIPETLWTYLHFLDDRGLLSPDSDPLPELLKPLRCYCGLDADGWPEPDREEPFPCECFVPYEGLTP